MKPNFKTSTALSSAASTSWLLESLSPMRAGDFLPTLRGLHGPRRYLVDPNFGAETVFLLSWGLFPTLEHQSQAAVTPEINFPSPDRLHRWLNITLIPLLETFLLMAII